MDLRQDRRARRAGGRSKSACRATPPAVGCRNEGAADIAAAMKAVTSALAGDDRGGVGDA